MSAPILVPATDDLLAGATLPVLVETQGFGWVEGVLHDGMVGRWAEDWSAQADYSRGNVHHLFQRAPVRLQTVVGSGDTFVHALAAIGSDDPDGDLLALAAAWEACRG